VAAHKVGIVDWTTTGNCVTKHDSDQPNGDRWTFLAWHFFLSFFIFSVSFLHSLFISRVFLCFLHCPFLFPSFLACFSYFFHSFFISFVSFLFLCFPRDHIYVNGKYFHFSCNSQITLRGKHPLRCKQRERDRFLLAYVWTANLNASVCIFSSQTASIRYFGAGGGGGCSRGMGAFIIIAGWFRNLTGYRRPRGRELV
jgi:hypothetical protein